MVHPMINTEVSVQRYTHWFAAVSNGMIMTVSQRRSRIAARK